jgi:ribonuclease Z
MIKREDETYVVPLGVAAAQPTAEHDNSYLAVVQDERYWLIDCGGNPIGRLMRAGLDPLNVEGIILTHFHPDHVYGLPAFLLGLFVMGIEQTRPRQRMLPIFARPEVLSQVEALVGLFDYQDWVWALPVTYHEVVPEVGALVTRSKQFDITAAPSRHSLPSLALRFSVPRRGQAFAYSSDTLPCIEVERLARGADLLIHEATGPGHGHSSAADAAALANRAGVNRLVLIHYPIAEGEGFLAEAEEIFEGQVTLAQEFTHYTF